MRKIFLCFLSVLLLVTPILAHAGKTDSKGGHTDSSTGDYHYHHGYSAHDHYDMDGDGIADCPYLFDDKTGSSSGSSSGTSSTDSVSNSSHSTRNETIYSLGYEDGYSTGVSEMKQRLADSEDSRTRLIQTFFFIGCAVFLVIAALIAVIRNKNKEYERLSKITDNRLHDSAMHSAHLYRKLYATRICISRLIDSPAETDTLIKNGEYLLNRDPTCELDVMLPNDVSISKNGIPLKGIVTPSRPFGDFTVFVTPHGSKFHRNPKCRTISEHSFLFPSSDHLFHASIRRQACSVCSRDLLFFKKPAWCYGLSRLSVSNPNSCDIPYFDSQSLIKLADSESSLIPSDSTSASVRLRSLNDAESKFEERVRLWEAQKSAETYEIKRLYEEAERLRMNSAQCAAIMDTDNAISDVADEAIHRADLPVSAPDPAPNPAPAPAPDPSPDPSPAPVTENESLWNRFQAWLRS